MFSIRLITPWHPFAPRQKDFLQVAIKNETEPYICTVNCVEKMKFSVESGFYFWFYYFGRISGAEK